MNTSALLSKLTAGLDVFSDSSGEPDDSKLWARKAILEHKRESVQLAFKARKFAVAACAILLLVMNPTLPVLYYECLLGLCLLFGWIHTRLNENGSVRPELILLVGDLILMTIAIAAGGGGDGGKTSADAAASQAATPVQTVTSATIAAPELVAEPQIVMGRFTTATEIRPILMATRMNWVAVRDYHGQDLLYLTHLLAWRCGLAQIKWGVNGGPMEVWPMPPCHEDTNAPNALTENDGLPYVALPAGSIETVEIELTYDDLGTESAAFARKLIQMP